MRFLDEQLVKFNVPVNDSKEAIKNAGILLQKAGLVEDHYTDAMIRTYEENGAYFVLAPSVALPHGRPEDGVKEAAVSFIQLKSPIEFGHKHNDPVSLVFGLAASDGGEHLKLLQRLSAILGDKEKVDQLKTVKDYTQFSKIIGGM